MALQNFSGDASQETYEQLACTAEFTGGTKKQLIFLSVLNILLSIVAFLGNTLILVALHKGSSLHPPSKLLFRSLAATDLCVGIIVEPLAVIYWLSVVTEKWSICRYTFVVSLIPGLILCSVSLMTLTAISVDRLLALLLGLRYRHVVTLKRTYAVIIVLWVVAIVGTLLSVWNNVILSSGIYSGTSLCLVTSTYCYVKIFLTLRHRQRRVQIVQRHPSQTIPVNTAARYRKTVFSTLWIQLTLLVCYLPYGVVAPATVANHGAPTPAIYLAKQITSTLVYLNSSLNPILYCWKIREVRKAVRETIRQIFCSRN